MEVCNLPRGAGKTSYLIYRSHVTKYPIVCMNETHRNVVLDKARQMNIEIPMPLTSRELLDRETKKTKIVLADEALYILSNLLNVRIDTATLTEFENEDTYMVRDGYGNEMITMPIR